MHISLKLIVVLIVVLLPGCVSFNDSSDLISDTMNMEFDEDNPFFTERTTYFGDSLGRVEVKAWYYNIYERGEYTARISSCDGLNRGDDFLGNNKTKALANEQAHLYKLNLEFTNVPITSYTCEITLERAGEVVETTRFTARP